jgi:ABC-2 type transport system ATP-binding protein
LKAEGKTIFLNSHLLSEVELISDRVAILDKGTLLKVGTIDDFTTTETNYEIGIAGSLTELFHHEAAATILKFRVDKHIISAELKNTSELNHLIDMLRTHHIEITHIAKRRSSLEESFINLIEGEGLPLSGESHAGGIHLTEAAQ